MLISLKEMSEERVAEVVCLKARTPSKDREAVPYIRALERDVDQVIALDPRTHIRSHWDDMTSSNRK